MPYRQLAGMAASQVPRTGPEGSAQVVPRLKLRSQRRLVGGQPVGQAAQGQLGSAGL